MEQQNRNKQMIAKAANALHTEDSEDMREVYKTLTNTSTTSSKQPQPNLKPNKYLIELLESASHVTNQLMEIATEYSDELPQFEVQYEINEHWALLFVGESVTLEQWAVTMSESDENDFIKMDITSEWNEHGDIQHVLEHYIAYKNQFTGDDGKVALND